jgi:very-short-patch-repair endonuclease
MGKSALEQTFINLWTIYYPEIVLASDLKIIPQRQFRYDFVHCQTKVAIEIQGGTYGGSRQGHSSGVGLDRDYEKNNLAQIHGYLVFQLSCKMITSTWLEKIKDVILSRLENNT